MIATLGFWRSQFTFLLLLCTAPLYGQILHAEGPLPSFEVVSVKPWKPRAAPIGSTAPIKFDPGPRSPSQNTNRVHFIGQIDLLIMDAYNLPVGSDRRILRAPRWVDSEAERYEIDARIDAATFAAMQAMTPQKQHEQIALLEQGLLAERFHLKLHFEVRGNTATYALIVAKGGLKMTPSKAGEATQLSLLNNKIIAQSVTLDQFAHSPLWTPVGNRLVEDQTGQTGTYDFTLEWRPDVAAADGASQGADDLPSLFDAIRNQLGLQVIDSKVALEVIVIDKIDRPSKN